MKSFFRNSFLFALGLLIVLEGILRFNHMTIDIPQREITSDGIQRYIPLQNGWWIGGTHKWQINQYGWPGPMPKSLDSLVLIIGDSHIENFMNDDACHQSSLLKQHLPQYNYLEVARSGISFIEAMYITSKLDTLHPFYKLLYVKDSDFTESISQLGRKEDIIQIDIEKKALLLGKMRSPMLKKVLYKIKVAYYTYNILQGAINKIRSNNNTQNFELDSLGVKGNRLSDSEIAMIEELFKYTHEQYDLNRFVLIFHPGTDARIVQLAKQNSFKTIVFPGKKKEIWGLDANDVSHWSCNGHKEAAEIIAKEILMIAPLEIIN